MADQYWSNVVLALPMDGANGSTTFTDISPAPKAVTRYGNAVISTAQSKFGGASAYFDGSGDYLTTPHDDNFNLSSGDFTVEFWFYIGTASTSRLISKRSVAENKTWSISVTSGGVLTFNFWNSAGTYHAAVGPTLTFGAWVHVAAVRYGDIYTVFINGVAGASFTSAQRPYTNTAPLSIGADLSNPTLDNTHGYIDDLRITKGVARYTADFTPPTVSYLADAIGYGSVATLIDQVASIGGTSIIGVAGIIPSQEIIGGAGEVLVALGTADISPPLHQAEATGTVPVVGLGDFSPPIEQANAAGTIPVTGQGAIVPSLDAVAAVAAGITATGEIIPSLDNVASAGTSAVVRAATVEQKKPVVGSTGGTSIICFGAVKTKDCKIEGAGRSNRWVGQVAFEPRVDVVSSAGVNSIIGYGEVKLNAGKTPNIESTGLSGEWVGHGDIVPNIESVASGGVVPVTGRGSIDGIKKSTVSAIGNASIVGNAGIFSCVPVVASRGIHVPVGQIILQGKALRLASTGTSSIKGAAIVSPPLSRVKASRYAKASLQSLAFGRGPIITGTVASPSIEPIHFTR